MVDIARPAFLIDIFEIEYFLNFLNAFFGNADGAEFFINVIILICAQARHDFGESFIKLG